MRAFPYAFLFAVMASPAFAGDQEVPDQCIASWGAKSPFKKGTPASSPLRFRREGPLWLGLNAGLSIEIPPAA